MKKFGVGAAAIVAIAGAAWTGNASADPIMVTKAPPPAVAQASPPAPVACGTLWDFVATSCPLTWYGVTVYGTVDVGGGWQSHGAPFGPLYTTGASYLIQKMNRTPMWGLAPNAMSQSNIGIKGNEPIGAGWNLVFDLEAGFDPYSLRFANGPGSQFAETNVPLNQQVTNGDSSRAGQWYNSVGYVGVSSPTYGTLTVFRQNALTMDGVLAYDPMSGSYAFSPIGFQGTTCGVGDTEDCRYSTSLKYRVNLGMFRAAGLWQFGGYGQDNASDGAYEGQVGADIHNVANGVLSVDGIYSYVRDAVATSLTGAPTNAAGLPLAPFAPQFFTATISDDTSVMALAKYTNGPLNLYGGYEWIQYAPPSDPQTAFTDVAGDFVAGFAASSASPNGLTAINNIAFSAGCAAATVCHDKILQVVWTGAKYAVTDKVDVIGAYYHYAQNNFFATGPNVGCSSSAHSQCSGTYDAVSAVVDWRFAAKWDTYIGFMFNQVNGGLANGFLQRNNVDPTAGLRFRF
ncbi:MAG: porin [Xanthobacteraceae bacterium]|jgi:predicted porin